MDIHVSSVYTLPLCTLALSALFHASNLHWSSVLHIVTYIFQCYSLILSQAPLLPHSPKVSSLHLCLFCCLALPSSFLNIPKVQFTIKRGGGGPEAISSKVYS